MIEIKFGVLGSAMAKRLKDDKEIRIERPQRAKLSAKEVIKRMEDFLSERSTSLPLSENVRVEVYLPDLPTPMRNNNQLSGFPPRQL
jgi:hypothetical protein